MNKEITLELIKKIYDESPVEYIKNKKIFKGIMLELKKHGFEMNFYFKYIKSLNIYNKKEKYEVHFIEELENINETSELFVYIIPENKSKEKVVMNYDLEKDEYDIYEKYDQKEEYIKKIINQGYEEIVFKSIELINEHYNLKLKRLLNTKETKISLKKINSYFEKE